MRMRRSAIHTEIQMLRHSEHSKSSVSPPSEVKNCFVSEPWDLGCIVVVYASVQHPDRKM